MAYFNKHKGVKGHKILADLAITTRIKEKDKETVLHRIKVLDHARVYGNDSASNAFNVSVRTIQNWKKILSDHHGSLNRLAKHSTRPIHTRKGTISQSIIDYIIDLKKDKSFLGKDKIAQFVLDERSIVVSATFVQDTITRARKHGLLDSREKIRLYARSSKILVKKPFKLKKKARRNGYEPLQPGDLIQCDTVVIYCNGRKFYILTAIDIFSRFAHARVSTSHSSKEFSKFIIEFQEHLHFTILHAQTDNGSEFAKCFEEVCTTLHITHFWNYKGNPKQNAFIERFNRTIQEEWQKQNESLFIQGEIELINHSLQEWLTWYNTRRPHWGIHLYTPQAVLDKWRNTQNV